MVPTPTSPLVMKTPETQPEVSWLLRWAASKGGAGRWGGFLCMYSFSIGAQLLYNAALVSAVQLESAVSRETSPPS